MHLNRRELVDLATVSLLGPSTSGAAALQSGQSNAGNERYEFRLAFDVWANDVRNEAVTLENWPYDDLDDKTVEGIVRALDLQVESGYNIVDLAGLWTTYAWPIDLGKVVDRDRQRRINQVLKAAHE